MTDINQILAERAKTHGDYRDHARTTQNLKRSFRQDIRRILNDSQLEAVDMILHKLGRIASGDPNFADHWDDIAGYATLVANQCRK